jgi:hypothetical protein
MPGQRGGGVRSRLTAAADAATAYLTHVLGEAGTQADGDPDAPRAVRWTLRREAYRTLAEARGAVALTAAELPALARHAQGADHVVTTLEQLVDATTACAVHLADTGRLTPQHTARLTELLDTLAGERHHTGLRVPEAAAVPALAG